MASCSLSCCYPRSFCLGEKRNREGLRRSHEELIPIPLIGWDFPGTDSALVEPFAFVNESMNKGKVEEVYYRKEYLTDQSISLLGALVKR